VMQNSKLIRSLLMARDCWSLSYARPL
jgi:hypothetical protein